MRKAIRWLLLFSNLIILATFVSAQVDTAWVRVYSAGGPGGGPGPAALAVDDSGNVYVTGVSTGGASMEDYASIKYAPNGDTLWVRRYNGPGNNFDWATALAVDDSGNVYVTGFSYDSAASNSDDYATIKYSPSGDTLWVRRYNFPVIAEIPADDAMAIAVDDSGNVYVTGISHGTISDGYDYATIKYSSAGNTLWVRRYNGTGNSLSDWAYALAVDDSGNVYVTGSSGVGDTLDYATIKYGPSGNTLWERRYNGPANGMDRPAGGILSLIFGHGLGHPLAVDDSGNVFVTGQSWNGTYYDYATIKYAPNGDVLWIRRYGGGNNSDGATALAIDDSGNVYVTGVGGTIKYAPNGDSLWVRPYHGLYPTGLAVDSSGNVYVTGDSATIKYAPNGDSLWAIPSYPASLTALAVDDSGSVYVTGFPNYADYITFKYVQKDRFRPNPDGWQFGNFEVNCNPPYNTCATCEPVMWPCYWWNQFDYSQSPPYPLDWKFFKRSDFPDWPLFVDAFGEGFCYLNPPPGVIVYNPLAVAKWLLIKGKMEGSCFGFALSSLLFYNKHLSLATTFPNSDYSKVHKVLIDNESRKLVNKYQLNQHNFSSLLNFAINWLTKSPNETISELQQMLNTEKKNDRILFLVKQNGWPGFHAVVACSLAQDNGNSNIYHIFVYDNILPGADERIDINTLTNTWEYDNMQNWGGSKGLFLSEPITSYLTTSISSMELSPKPISAKNQNNPFNFLEIYNSSSNNIVIRNSIEDAIGFSNSDSSLIDSIPNAAPIIPITGGEHPPIGYFVPKGDYSSQVSNSADSDFYFSVFTDSTVFDYERADFDSGQTDYLRYFDSEKKFQVKSEDATHKNIHLSLISTEVGRVLVCNMDNLVLFQNDSLQIHIADSSRFDLVNFGSSKTYTLTLELAADSINPIFSHPGISMSPNSMHRITPDWENLDSQSVSIFIDTDLDSIFDDTIQVLSCSAKPGDANANGAYTLADIIATVNYIFNKPGCSPLPLCWLSNLLCRGDWDGSGIVTLGDVIRGVNYIFNKPGGPWNALPSGVCCL